MGGTTIEGLVRGKTFNNEDITVSDPNQATLKKFAKMGVKTTSENHKAAKDADIVCVVVKPWLVETVLRGIKSALNPQKQLLIVVAAGVSSESIKKWLNLNCPPLFLVIPNIAIAQITLASCGIAYAMRYIRAASEGGVELGFKADDAKKIVLQTLRGAVELLAETGLHPEAAIDLVTTPDGVSIRGLNEMEHAGFTSAVIRGLKAGIKK